MAMPAQLKSLASMFDLHPGTMRFEVSVSHHDLGSWTTCSGLSVKFDNKQIADLRYNAMRVVPGQVTFGEVRLKRVLTHSGARKVQTWLTQHARKPDPDGTTARITLVDAWGSDVAEWELNRVIPRSWSGPDLDASPSSKQLAMETLELSHDGFLKVQERNIAGYFTVTVDGQHLGLWSQCDGLGVKFDNKPVVDGANGSVRYAPGKPSYGELKLTRPMTVKDAKTVRTWLDRHVKKPDPNGYTASVTLYDAWGRKIDSWDFRGVVPKGWSGPKLDATTKPVAYETLELSHGGFLDPGGAMGGSFTVDVGHASLGTWTVVKGLGAQFPTETRKTGGKNEVTVLVSEPAKPQDITLERPLDPDGLKNVMAWIARVTAPESTTKQTDATITYHDPWGGATATWKLIGVVPTKWAGPTLDARPSAIATESLTLRPAGIELERAGTTQHSGGGTGAPPSQDRKPLAQGQASLSADEQHTVRFAAADPTRLTLSRAARYLTVPHGLGSEPLGHSRNEYRGSGAATLSADVDLVGTEAKGGSVDEQRAMLEGWTRPAGPGKPPPRLTFTWYTMRFEGYLRDLSITVQRFGKDNKPAKATASFVLQEEPLVKGGTNPTSGGPPGRRACLLAEGDTIQSVAFREYGDAAAWRALAAANGIDDPLRVAPGTRLLLPPAT